MTTQTISVRQYLDRRFQGEGSSRWQKQCQEMEDKKFRVHRGQGEVEA